MKNTTRNTLFLIIGLLLFGFSLTASPVRAADANFSDGITVDSVLDTADQTVGDTICDDGDGNCTLRAALQEAQFTAGINTINFNIAGSGVKTIQPSSALPAIDDPIIINGYSQPGSQANSAPSPLPFNGTLLIEIDGTNAGASDGLSFLDNASGSSISGLVINRFVNHGLSIKGTNITDITITGNYIGTSVDGTSRLVNGQQAVTLFPSTSATDITIGGPTPAARNIITSHSTATGINTATGITGLIHAQGNYIGLAADGFTDIGGGSGVIVSTGIELIDNVISGNSQLNVALNGPSARVTGNLIGTDYLGRINSNIQQGAGITVNQTATDTIIGGLTHADANIIAGNTVGGILISEVTLPFPLVLTPTKITIVGNSIYGNESGEYMGLGVAPGLGIDALRAELDGSFVPQTSIGVGPTLNDALDSDVGPNNYINFPIINAVSQSSTSVTVNYDLDAADSPTDQYRVEFFANDEADPSGYGEGQTYLGSANTSNGNSQLANLVVGENIDLAGKSISATTTAIDPSTTSGFGATSEFSRAVLLPKSQGVTNLASTGENIAAYLLVGSVVLALSITVLVQKFK